MDGKPAGPRPRFAAGDDANPAVVKFEIERRAGGDRLGCGDDACDRIAHHDVAARQQALMTFRMGGEAPGEIVSGLMFSGDSARDRGAQPRLGLGDPGASTIDIGRQHLGPQSRCGQIKAVTGGSQVVLGGQPQPLGAVVEALRCGPEQILRIGEPACQPGEM